MAMSAEPGRRAPYSVDLWWRIVWQRIGRELSFCDIACNINVSLGTAHGIFKHFHETGDLAAHEIARRPDVKEARQECQNPSNSHYSE